MFIVSLYCATHPPVNLDLSGWLSQQQQAHAGPKKANTIDKSADDWKGFKSQNADVKDELNEYNKSSNKYLEKQAFLKKAEYTEYEKSRDERLASDIRTRGRT